jgi:hypothetical protein
MLYVLFSSLKRKKEIFIWLDFWVIILQVIATSKATYLSHFLSINVN